MVTALELEQALSGDSELEFRMSSIAGDFSQRSGSLYYQDSTHHSRCSNPMPLTPLHEVRVRPEDSAIDIPISHLAKEDEAETPPSRRKRLQASFFAYWRKWGGSHENPLPRLPLYEVFWSWLGAFAGICAVAYLDFNFNHDFNFPLLVASFGASAVLLFGVPESKLAQPRNLMGGQILSAFIGLAIRHVIGGDMIFVGSALGMSLALAVMQLTGTTHPPGGATALVIASAKVMPQWHGLQFVVAVAWGSAVLMVLSLVINNLSPHRRYPTYW